MDDFKFSNPQEIYNRLNFNVLSYSKLCAVLDLSIDEPLGPFLALARFNALRIGASHVMGHHNSFQKTFFSFRERLKSFRHFSTGSFS